MNDLQREIISSTMMLWHLKKAGRPMSIRTLARRVHLSEDDARRILSGLNMVRSGDDLYEYVDVLVEGDRVELGADLSQRLERGTMVLSHEEFLALVQVIRAMEQARTGVTLRSCMPLLRRLVRTVRPGEDLPVDIHADPLPEAWVPVRNVALPRRHVLEMDYWTLSRDEVGRREVVPLRFLKDGEHWHLRAWCLFRKDFRTFRLDRVVRFRDTGRRYREPIPRDDDSHPARNREARVRFDPDVASWARERFPDATVLPDGSLEALIPFTSELLFAAWILSMSGHARVLDPEDVRRRIRDRLAEAFGRDGASI
ncbi:MAG TPA: WYL domain-containing protein [Myxococcota bacterium]|nr:WYL domain-containing protein [Myxococcota bacterium]HQK50326.1 WYL domain-containing protein [Myxococcota bacterium]